MNTEHTKFIIETLNEAVDWFGYVPEYFADKHDLDKDKENIKKSIKLLKDFESRTCGWTLDEQTCGYVTFNTGCGSEFMFESELKHYNFCPKCGNKIDSKELEEIKDAN